MIWARHSAGGFWRCKVKQRAYQRECNRRRYDAMDGLAYNLLLLQHRRVQALARRRDREADRG